MLNLKKKKNIIAAIVAVLVACCAIVIPMTFGMGMTDKIDYNYNYNQSISEAKVQKDIKQLIDLVESTHPIFLKGTPDDYNIAKSELLNTGEISGEKFQKKVMKFLAVFKDLHTRVELGINLDEYVGVYNDFSLAIDSIKNVVVNTYDEKGVPKGAILKSINGIPYEGISNKISELLAVENKTTKLFSVSYINKLSFLKYAITNIEDNIATFSFELDGKSYDKKVEYYLYKDYIKTLGNSNAPPNKIDNFMVSLNDDVMTIRAKACMDDGSYNKAIEEITKNINSDITKVIFDLRGNGGGSDYYVTNILTKLGFEYSQIGSTYRYSYTTRRYKNTVLLTGSAFRDFVYKSRNNKNIQLKVLCDEQTSSAALTAVSLVRYSDLGEIIGRASAQSPNFNGNITTHSLRNSKLPIALPISTNLYKYNGNEVSNIIIPDKQVGIFENYNDYIKFD